MITPTQEDLAFRATPIRRWRMWLAAAAILVSGIGIGAVLGASWVRNTELPPFMDPERAAVRMADLVAFRLQLSPDERDSVLRVFESKRPRIDSTRLKIYPEMLEILDEVGREVAALLSPEKALIWNTQFDQLREKWRPRPAESQE